MERVPVEKQLLHLPPDTITAKHTRLELFRPQLTSFQRQNGTSPWSIYH